MPTSDELRALADRVEALTGDNRHIDVWIWQRFEADKFARMVSDVRATSSRNSSEDEVADKVKHKAIRVAPAYTASLDAAMTLVPDRWHTDLAHEDRHSHSWRWELRGGFGWNTAARAATPALALTAAALRAHATGADHG